MYQNRLFRVNFYGFYSGFNKEDNFIVNSIRKIGEVEISNSPDYVFYSVFDNEYLLFDTAVRIFFTGENIAPNFQLCDYAIGFERLDFGDRYLRFPFYYGMNEYCEDVIRAKHKHENISLELCNREFCSFVYSNADTDGMRKAIFDSCNDYRRVDSGGRLYHSIMEPSVLNKHEFESGYKFSIACENSSHLGYCTEKIVQSFGAQTVPIYYGDVSVNQDFNEEAFVNCHSFACIDDAIQYIIYLDQNDSAYLSMLEKQAFVRENQDILFRNQFDSFIANIFEQDYEKAFRRNRFFWGKRMDEKYKKLYRCEKMIRKLIRH